MSCGTVADSSSVSLLSSSSSLPVAASRPRLAAALNPRLAKIYYGDSQKFPIIAKYNNFGDATRIRVDQRIKIPEVEGVELLVGKEPVETEALEVADLGFA